MQKQCHSELDEFHAIIVVEIQLILLHGFWSFHSCTHISMRLSRECTHVLQVSEQKSSLVSAHYVALQSCNVNVESAKLKVSFNLAQQMAGHVWHIGSTDMHVELHMSRECQFSYKLNSYIS